MMRNLGKWRRPLREALRDHLPNLFRVGKGHGFRVGGVSGKRVMKCSAVRITSANDPSFCWEMALNRR
jgi:hypothetical protein